MTWDVTVTDTLALSYLDATSTAEGAAAEGAASRKELKYLALTSTHTFIPLTFETLGPINSKGLSFFSELGHHLAAQVTNEKQRFYISDCPPQSSASTPSVSMAVSKSKQTPTPNHSDKF